MYKQDVVKQIILGSEDAFNTMYQDCSPAIYNAAMKRLQSEILSKLVVQDTFIEIHSTIRSLDDPALFDEYVYKLTQAMIDKAQAKQKKPKQPEKSEPEKKTQQQDITTTENIGEIEDEWEPIFFEPDEGEKSEEYSFNVSVWPAQPNPNTKQAPKNDILNDEFNFNSFEDFSQTQNEYSQEKVFGAQEMQKNGVLDGPRRIRGPRKSERKRSFWSMMCMLIALVLIIVAVYILAKENLFLK